MTASSLKLTVLGGGSFFVPSFVGTMCNKAEVFDGAEVRLHDPDAERVALVKSFCERLARARKISMSFVEAPDLDASLDGADFVISTFRVGGVKSLLMDESIPPQFGYYGDETVGPGGMFMAVRTVPVLLDIARRMQRLCPNAWLLNYANPTNFIADALHRSGYTRSVSLCDGFICPPSDIGVTLGIPGEEIVTRHAGFNHCSWVYRAERNGRDLFEDLRAIDEETLEANLSARLDEAGALRRRRWLDVFRTLGLYPVPAGHLEPYFFYEEWVAHQQQSQQQSHTHQADRNRKNWDSLRAVLAEWDDDAAAKVARTHFGGHADLAIGVAAALATDSGEVFPVNVPHGQAVPGFAPETVLEIYCIVNSDGFTPTEAVPQFPPAILAHQKLLTECQQMVVSGILDKDREQIFQALCVHPFTNSIATARKLFDEMWRQEHDVLGAYWTG